MLVNFIFFAQIKEGCSLFYDSELFFLQKIFKKIHLQVILVDPTAALDQRIDLGLRKLLGKDTELKSFNEYFNIEHNAIY